MGKIFRPKNIYGFVLSILFLYTSVSALASQGNIKQYIKILQNQAIAVTQQDIKELVQDLFIQGVVDSILEQNERAYESFSQVLKLDPANACVHYKLSQVLHKLPHLANKKRFITDSYTHIYAAIELSSKTKIYYYTAIEMHINSNECTEACLLYEEMFQHFIPTCQDLLNLAHLYMQAKEFRQAIRVYSQLEQKIGVNQDLIKEKHAAFLAMNEIEMAITDAMKLAAQFPGNEDYINNLAELFLENGQITVAIQFLKDHAVVYPLHMNSLQLLTNTLLDQDRIDEAFSYMKILFKSSLITLEKKLAMLDKYLGAIIEGDKNLQHDELVDILILTHPASVEVYDACAHLYSVVGDTKKCSEINKKANQVISN